MQTYWRNETDHATTPLALMAEGKCDFRCRWQIRNRVSARWYTDGGDGGCVKRGMGRVTLAAMNPSPTMALDQSCRCAPPSQQVLCTCMSLLRNSVLTAATGRR